MPTPTSTASRAESLSARLFTGSCGTTNRASRMRRALTASVIENPAVTGWLFSRSRESSACAVSPVKYGYSPVRTAPAYQNRRLRSQYSALPAGGGTVAFRSLYPSGAHRDYTRWGIPNTIWGILDTALPAQHSHHPKRTIWKSSASLFRNRSPVSPPTNPQCVLLGYSLRGGPPW